MIDAVVMDFDGVIIDSEKLWYVIIRDWLENNCDYRLKIDEFLICVGSHIDDLISSLKDKGISFSIPRFLEETKEDFIERSSQIAEMNGVSSFLRTVKDHGLLLGLATSSRKEKPYYHLKRLGLFPLFDVIVTAEMVDHIKPAPDLYLLAAQMLGCEPHRCLAIEDSYNGLLSAQKAGLKTLVIPNEITRNLSLENTDFRCDSLANLSIEEFISDQKE